MRTIALVGPTAVGKTDAAIELAKRLGAEIIGCDSMQVYRGMGKLTEQPTPAQRAEAVHHLVDCIEPEEAFNVGLYRRLAVEAIAQIQQRGRAALIVGGTGLYLKALTNGLCDAPPENSRIRKALWAQAEADGSDALYARLRTVDPETAARVHPKNARRVVRALEVYELTGQPLSRGWTWRSHDASPAKPGALEMTVIGLLREREVLCARINQRVERMIRDESVLNEVRALLERSLSQTAQQAHGLAFLEAYLQGRATREDTIPLWQQQVRRYAKRQLTWFRAQPQIHWVTLHQDESSSSIMDRLLLLTTHP